MKKMTTVMLGLSLALGTAALSFAADQPKDAKPAPAATNTNAKKKHSKKHKKANKPAAIAATPAPAPTK